MQTTTSSAQQVIGTAGSDVPRKRRKVTRTRAGCLTCRRRRKACDMGKPDCGACVRLKQGCSWPSTGPSNIEDTIRIGQYHQSPQRQSTPISSSAPNIPLFNQPERFPTNVLNKTATVLQPIVDVQVGDSRRCSLPDASGSSLCIDDFGTTRDVGSLRHIIPERTAPTWIEETLRDETNLQNIDLDEILLQSWAAHCLSAPAAQSQDPFLSLSHLLGLQEGASLQEPLPIPRPQSPSDPQYGPLLQHYQRSLTKLVSCTTEGTPSAFEAFTQLATAQSTSAAGRALHLAILAWAGRHMTNEGEVKYEALSEKLGREASRILADQALQVEREGDTTAEMARLTLLAGQLMLIQWKICRGDVWGYEPDIRLVASLAKSLYTPARQGLASSSIPFSFFENLLYHDILVGYRVRDPCVLLIAQSTQAYLTGSIIPYTTLLSYSSPALDNLNTLTGACLPLFLRMYQVADLTKKSRARTLWDDDSLVDIVEAAERLEVELKGEKKRMDDMVRDQPHMQSHRYLHEAFRISCLLSLSTFVLRTPPSALRVRLLVRQALSLLEQMHDQHLPGYCSSHWVMFVTALSCTPGGIGRDELDDVQRVEQLYDDFEIDWAFRNIPRSRRIAQEVRARNDAGQRHVHWLDVVEEYDWQLWLV